MIEDLLKRTEKYFERISNIPDRADEEDSYEPDEFADREDWLENAIPEEIVFDADAKHVSRNVPYWKDLWPSRPVRYRVSPDNPWYFEIDGVVFFRETGMLVLFPPGKGEEYTVPDDERITGIGISAFAGNQILRRIHLNDRIRYIGDHAFCGCGALEEITLPATVEHVGSTALAGCASLKKAVLECDISDIPDGLFQYDTSLESVIYQAGITSVGSHAFYRCSSLKSVKPAGGKETEADVVISPSVRELKMDAFTECVSVCSVWLPDGLKTIGRWAFRMCSSLRSIRTDAVEHYEAGCFQMCDSLEEFTFGCGTKSLGTALFTRTDNLKRIHFSCAPELECAADALPQDAEYLVDTRAYLKSVKPYGCKPLFHACIRNIAGGETVPDETLDAVIRILRRNRKRNHEWFLEDEQILTWILNAGIPDCGDCTDMLKLAEGKNPVLADRVRTYMEDHYTDRHIATALDKWEKQDRERKEAEQREMERREQERIRREEEERKKADILARALAGEDIALEDMDLSQRAYGFFRERGISWMSEVEELIDSNDAWKIVPWGVSREADEKLTYFRPDRTDSEFRMDEQDLTFDELGDFTVEDLTALDLDDL